jgi:hypothetical protein
MIERIIEEYSNGKITIINKSEEETPAEEITKDIVPWSRANWVSFLLII